MAKLYKNGRYLDIAVLGTEELDLFDDFKNKVFKSIGDKDYYQHVGKGEQTLNLKIFLKDKDAYDSLIGFFYDGTAFALELNDISKTYNLNGGIKSTKSLADDSYIAEINLTSALDPDFDDVGFDTQLTLKETIFKKSTALETLRNWSKSTMSFVENTNSKVASFTGKYQEYSVAITQITNGVASSGSIITSPLSSIINSTSSIIGGVAGIVSSIGTAINAIKQTPNQLDGLIDSLLDIGDQFANIFNLNNKSDQAKTTTNFLTSVSAALIEVDNQDLSPRIVTEEPYSVSYDPEIVIEDKKGSNNDILSVLVLSSILLAIYEESTQVTRWNKTDLDNLLKQTETLFEYITSKNISSDIRSALILARNNFFASFNALYKNASKTVVVDVLEPKFLSDVVYSVNGNFDYYNDTKKLNNIIGSVVQGRIEVISND